MNSKILSQIKNKLKNILKDKEILDIILFGSTIKGKANPGDIDIAIVTERKTNPKIKGFHISTISPKEFFKKPPTIITTLLREGYSIRNKKSLAESLNFKNKVLITYKLLNLKPSKKVQIVNILRGKNKLSGLVEKNKGKWLANQVFTIPINNEHIFNKLFQNLNIKYTKNYILIH